MALNPARTPEIAEVVLMAVPTKKVITKGYSGEGPPTLKLDDRQQKERDKNRVKRENAQRKDLVERI